MKKIQIQGMHHVTIVGSTKQSAPIIDPLLAVMEVLTLIAALLTLCLRGMCSSAFRSSSPLLRLRAAVATGA